MIEGLVLTKKKSFFLLSFTVRVVRGSLTLFFVIFFSLIR